MRATAARYAVGMCCALAGSLLLVAPHRLDTMPFALVGMPWWGAAFLLAGTILLLSAALPLPLLRSLLLLRGDPARLRQVLLNLVSNAVKFTEQGEVIARVRLVEQTTDAATLRFDVRDTGIGISAEARTRLFAPFTQADSSTTRKYGGTGLGLAIPKRLVEVMDGEIGVESEEGQGSTFWFAVRLGQSKADGIDVAEDNAVNQRVVVRMLERLGYGVDVVANGAEAVDAVARLSYAAILMDCQMPEMDGYEATRVIRTWEQRTDASVGRRVPIIALTANALAADRGRCLHPMDLPWSRQDAVRANVGAENMRTEEDRDARGSWRTGVRRAARGGSVIAW